MSARTSPTSVVDVLKKVALLGHERDAALTALHGMRRRVARLNDQVEELQAKLDHATELLENSEDWQQGLLEDHWDHLRDHAIEDERERRLEEE